MHQTEQFAIHSFEPMPVPAPQSIASLVDLAICRSVAVLISHDERDLFCLGELGGKALGQQLGAGLSRESLRRKKSVRLPTEACREFCQQWDLIHSPLLLSEIAISFSDIVRGQPLKALRTMV